MTLPLRSQQRIQAMGDLVAELGRRPLTVQQAADVLGMTHAGSKNYIRDLRLAGLVSAPEYTAGNVGPRAPIYHLTDNVQAIETYLADLKSHNPAPRKRTCYGTLLDRAMKDPTRHLHVMQDDVHYQPPMQRVKPFRDCLVAAPFGAAAGAHA